MHNILVSILGIFLLRKAIKCDFLYKRPVNVWSGVNVLLMIASALAFLMQDTMQTVRVIMLFDKIGYDPTLDDESAIILIAQWIMFGLTGISVVNVFVQTIVGVLSFFKQPKCYFTVFDDSHLDIDDIMLEDDGDDNNKVNAINSNEPGQEGEKKRLLLLIHEYYVQGLFVLAFLCLVTTLFSVLTHCMYLVRTYLFLQNTEVTNLGC